MSKQPGAQCSVCTRVSGVAAKVLANQPITDTDRATIRRVTGPHSPDSIEAKVAQSRGYLKLFQGLTAPAPADEWPRQVTAWECSDGSLRLDEPTALRIELTLTRNRRQAA